jgi:GMP synthase (glutamine-hydrolysing)
MEKILIIKAGSTMPSLAARRGDFEDWILAGMGVDIKRTAIVDVRNGASLPPYKHISGVVITGSHAMVTEHRDWSERTALWLRGAFERKIPTLGICYGHHLLAYALGGEVGDFSNGLEAGTVDVHLNRAVQDDPLFAGFPSPMQGVHGAPPIGAAPATRCAPLGVERHGRKSGLCDRGVCLGGAVPS